MQAVENGGMGSQCSADLAMLRAQLRLRPRAMLAPCADIPQRQHVCIGKMARGTVGRSKDGRAVSAASRWADYRLSKNEFLRVLRALAVNLNFAASPTPEGHQ
jgi:hypothetical protein